MNKDLSRMLDIAGVKPKNEFVNNLYEKYGIDGEGRQKSKNFEGPFRMTNGRKVYYNVEEKAFVDGVSEQALTEEETFDLYSVDKPFKSHDVALYAYKSNEENPLVLKLESIQEIKPMATRLFDNGYSRFKYSDETVSKKPFTIYDKEVDLSEKHDTDEKFEKGDKVKYGNKEKFVVVPDAKADMVGIADKPDGKAEMVKSADLTKILQDTVNESKKDPCWEGYVMVGMKKESGKEVPNCVPEDEAKRLKEGSDDLTKEEEKRLDKLKKKYEDSDMYDNMIEQYGKEKGKNVFYAKLTQWAKEGKGLSEGFDEDHLADDLSDQLIQITRPYIGSGGYIMKPRDFKADVMRLLSRNDVSIPESALDELIKKMNSLGDDLFSKGDHNSTYSMYLYHVRNMIEDFVNEHDEHEEYDYTERSMRRGEMGRYEEGIKEAKAVDATLFYNSNYDFDAVDNLDKKRNRTGTDDLRSEKVNVPKEVTKAIDQRIKELKASMKDYDGNGYNEKSVKPLAIDALEQIKKNLSSNDYEGWMEANIFFNTLMSPIWDLIPAQVVRFLAKGDEDTVAGAS